MSKLSEVLTNVYLLGSYFIAFLVCVSLFASSYWFFDLLKQFYVQYALLLIPGLIITVVLAKWKGLVVLWLAFLVCAFPIVSFFIPRTNPPAGNSPVKIMSFNVLAKNTSYSELVDYVNTESPDVLVFYEVNEQWENSFAPLIDQYEYSICESRRDTHGICLFSKLEWERGDIKNLGPESFPAVDVTFRLGRNNKVQIVGLHAAAPGGPNATKQRDAQLAEAANLFNDKANKHLMVGDFNNTLFSPVMKDIQRTADLKDSAKGRGIELTWSMFPTWLGGLKIDHALVNDAVHVEEYKFGPNLGSDHKPIIITIN